MKRILLTATLALGLSALAAEAAATTAPPPGLPPIKTKGKAADVALLVDGNDAAATPVTVTGKIRKTRKATKLGGVRLPATHGAFVLGIATDDGRTVEVALRAPKPVTLAVKKGEKVTLVSEGGRVTLTAADGRLLAMTATAPVAKGAEVAVAPLTVTPHGLADECRKDVGGQRYARRRYVDVVTVEGTTVSTTGGWGRLALPDGRAYAVLVDDSEVVPVPAPAAGDAPGAVASPKDNPCAGVDADGAMPRRVLVAMVAEKAGKAKGKKK